MASIVSEDRIPISAQQQTVEPLPSSSLVLPKEGPPFTLDGAVVEGIVLTIVK